jgi:hypothetical protein
MVPRQEILERLKLLLHEFKATFDPHLDPAALHELGVDAVEFDLENETERGGCYFLPMSQERLAAEGQRQDLKLNFWHKERPTGWKWLMEDARTIQGALIRQVGDRETDENAPSALQTTRWDYGL